MITKKDCKYFGFCDWQREEYGNFGFILDRKCDGCEHFKSIHPEPPYLKPCPFCGGEAEIKKKTVCGGHGDYGPMKYVKCTKCGIKTASYACDGYYSSDMTDEEMAEVWNRRV